MAWAKSSMACKDKLVGNFISRLTIKILAVTRKLAILPIYRRE